MEQIHNNELPIETCRNKGEFVKRLMKPLLQTINPLILDVNYEYCINGYIAIDEYIEIHYRGGSFLRISVARSSLAQMALDTIKVVVGEVKA